MDTVKSSLRALLDAHMDANPGTKLADVAERSKVPFWSLYRFSRQQCVVFDVEHAGLLYSFLTGGKQLVGEVER